MKALIIILLCGLSAKIVGQFDTLLQDCLNKQHAVITKDRFTEIQVAHFKDAFVTKKKSGEQLYVTGFAAADELKFIRASFWTDQIACVEQGETVYFLFEDGHKEQAGTNGEFNCDGNFVFEASGDDIYDSIVMDLALRELRAIRMVANGGVFEHDLTAAGSKGLKEKFLCLFRYCLTH